ncbi:hypothetical protein NA56DRAFT_698720 [Hyaloscypha hepaticicola]|uniref:Uncharacterized protein n=1 Tax=Hyaloscypha hepaticicola TaxID=2082293 RepID=A0A2J6QHB7_9HELO|nr:hypothetical protein NA56DRAFT_698720 [Hyaloscypha hepaticicola]
MFASLAYSLANPLLSQQYRQTSDNTTINPRRMIFLNIVTFIYIPNFFPLLDPSFFSPSKKAHTRLPSDNQPSFHLLQWLATTSSSHFTSHSSLLTSSRHLFSPTLSHLFSPTLVTMAPTLHSFTRLIIQAFTDEGIEDQLKEYDLLLLPYSPPSSGRGRHVRPPRPTINRATTENCELRLL